MEISQLRWQIGAESAGQLEGETLFEMFAHQMGFADAASTVEREELGLGAVEQSRQTRALPVSSDEGHIISGQKLSKIEHLAK